MVGWSWSARRSLAGWLADENPLFVASDRESSDSRIPPSLLLSGLEIKGKSMERANDRPVLEGSLAQWSPSVWAIVVDGVERPLMLEHRNEGTEGRYGLTLTLSEFVGATDAKEVRHGGGPYYRIMGAAIP